MLDLLRKDGILDTLDARIAELFDTNAAVNRFSHRVLTSNTFMAPIATFVRRKADKAMEQKYSTAFVTKDQMDTLEIDNDVDDWPPSGSDSENDKTP